MSAILSDITVLDLTRVAAGPWCTQLLADMGANVYKVERPGTGDDARKFRPFTASANGTDAPESAFFVALNRGKRSITINIAQPEGAALVRELAANADILVENYKAGGLEKYGLDYESIRKINPAIIYCSITGFGQTGPYARRPAYDSIMQAGAGLMALCGDPHGEPQRTAIAVADLTTGYCAAVGILGAYIHRLRTGVGQHIDTAMLDTSVALTAQYASAYLLTGEIPARAGNRAPNTYPSGTFRAADRQIVMVCGNDRQFGSLCRLLGLEQLIDDPRFATNVSRREHHAELAEYLNDKLAERPANEWASLLEEAGVPSTPINRMNDVFNDPQVIHRQLQVEVERADGTMLPVVRSPLNFTATPVSHRRPPALGEHTDSILKSELNKDDADVARLRERGII